MKRPAPLRLLWDHHRPTVVLMAVAVLVAVFFAGRFVLHMANWHDLEGTRPAIEPWMTVRFVATAWHVPPKDIITAIHGPETQRRQTLEDIARQQGRPVAALIAELTTFLHDHPAHK